MQVFIFIVSIITIGINAYLIVQAVKINKKNKVIEKELEQRP
jgi:hypothetical protein